MTVRSLFCSFVICSAVFALECPDRIQFKNGNDLKRGSQFYHPTGQYLIRGTDQVYYSNGNSLYRNGNFYYSNGNYFQRGDRLYYPNGNYLKNGQNYYWSNGNYLLRGENFYYQNGNYARRNGKLYRADGTLSPFPVYLETPIGTLGELFARVDVSSHTLELNFDSMMSSKNGVTLRGLWDGATFSQLQMEISTGYPNEFVVVHLALMDASVRCELVGGEGLPPKEFQLFTPAANVKVQVKPGYSMEGVRNALREALHKLSPSHSD